MLLDHLLSRVGRRLCQVAGRGQASCPPAGRAAPGRPGDPASRRPGGWWRWCP